MLQDYVNIMKFLMKHWDIEARTGLSSEAQEAQDHVCNLLTRFQKLTDRQARVAGKRKEEAINFSWIFNRPLNVRPM